MATAGGAWAADATWSTSPGSGNFNANANWVGGTVPEGTATFGASGVTSLSFSQQTTTGAWVFAPGAPAYDFAVDSVIGVEFTGAGIETNGAPVTVTVGMSSSLYFSNASTADDANLVNATSQSSIVFGDESTAANAHIMNSGGVLHFVGSSTADSATITTQARTIFDDYATGGNATIANSGDLEFYYHSTAGNAVIANSAGGNVLFQGFSDAGSATITNHGDLRFLDDTKVGTATITNYNSLTFETAANADGATIDNQHLTYFKDYSSAGSATITNSGTIYFRDNSTAASATIENRDSAILRFEGNSSAGEAQVQNDGVLFFVGTSQAASATINTTKLLGFQGTATAGDATIINSATGQIIFFDEATGGNAQIVNDGYFDIANTTPGFANSVGSLAGSGEFHLGDHLLTIGSNDLSTEVSGVIDGVGGSLTKVGSGTLTLSGANLYTGPTEVDGGKLVVNGSLLSAVTVNDGAALGGNGQVAGITANLGAIIAPGNSIGTLGVNGNVAFAAGSTYQVEIDGTGASDRIAATGSATLDGGTVAVQSSASGYALGTRYTILTADLGVTGTFATLQAPTMTPFLAFSLGYDPANVYLNVDRSAVTFASAGQTPNETATGGGVDSLPLSSPVVGALSQLDLAGAAAALNQLSGEEHASIKGVMIDDSRFVREAALDRLRAAFGDGVATGQTVAAYDATGAVKVPANTDRFALWGGGFGSWGSWDGNRNAASVDRDIGGLFVGADGRVGDAWRLGVIGGYSQSNFSFDGRNASATSDNYDIGVYAGTEWGAVAFRSGLAYTWHDISTSRGVAFPGLIENLSADYSAGTAQAFGELAYELKAGQTAFEPFANLAYVNLSTDGFTEQGGAAALTSESGDDGVTYTTLGLRASTVFAIGNGMTATARGMLGWRHAFGDTAPVSTFAFSGGSAFNIAGVPIATDAALLDAGLDVNLTSTATIGINYGGQLSSDSTDQTLSGTFKVAF
ncbi:autotransporter outer membrane beta-barrel domain-containing protein [Kaistia algarum]|uniref:autotransporter outer membrane beta-barrel domain-containing protein n=1 Tax=Kaistia algarum TaxID=2083279 RepID=UPI00225223CE|nr:autotransporter domain-containing protein [Kaistia algarum]MCX5516566.1 autotransporter domain-containing protein [Kaistia algarum]